MKIYKNQKRISGSQSETPTIKITPNSIIINGYQKFILTKTITEPHSYKSKFSFINTFLKTYNSECESIADIGCSNGIVCFMAKQAGFKHIYALDHDEQCLEIIKTADSSLWPDSSSSIIVKKYSFGDPIEPPVDLAIMCALIHWIYSCTALYGCFDKISTYLATCTKKYLLIEWVEPTDSAIKAFSHLKYNSSIIKEPYTKNNFIASLKRYFTKVELVLEVTSTRKLYLATI